MKRKGVHICDWGVCFECVADIAKNQSNVSFSVLFIENKNNSFEAHSEQVSYLYPLQ